MASWGEETKKLAKLKINGGSANSGLTPENVFGAAQYKPLEQPFVQKNIGADAFSSEGITKPVPVLTGAEDAKAPTTIGVTPDTMKNDMLTRGVNLGKVENTNPVTAANSTVQRSIEKFGIPKDDPTRTVFEQNQSGAVVPVKRPISPARQTFGLPPASNGITSINSKDGISIQFPEGTDPNVIARSKLVGSENDQRRAYNLTPEGVAKEGQMVQQFNVLDANRAQQYPLRNAVDPLNKGITAGMGLEERNAIRNLNQQASQSAAQNKTQLTVAGMNEGTARERNANEFTLGEGNLGIARENVNINKGTAASQTAERAVSTEAKGMEVAKLKRIDELNQEYADAMGDPKKMAEVSKKMIAVQGKPQQKFQVVPADTVGPDGFTPLKRSIIVDSEGNQTVVGGDGGDWAMKEIQSNPAYLAAYSKADPKKQQEMLAKMRERRGL